MFILTKIEIIRLMADIKLNFNYRRQDFKKIFYIYFLYIFYYNRLSFFSRYLQKNIAIK